MYHLPGRAALHQLDAPRDSPSNPPPRLWRRLQPLSIDKMPLEVSPPRTSRFGSPLVLSRVHWSPRSSFSPGPTTICCAKWFTRACAGTSRPPPAAAPPETRRGEEHCRSLEAAARLRFQA